MNYEDFLTVLMKLSVKLYARTSRSRDDAFEQLLSDNILPLASRRCPEDVSGFMHNESVAKLFDYYGDALRQIFTYYASSDQRTHAAQPGYGSVLAQGSGMGMSHSGASPVKATRAINTMKEAMGYPGEPPQQQQQQPPAPALALTPFPPTHTHPGPPSPSPPPTRLPALRGLL